MLYGTGDEKIFAIWELRCKIAGDGVPDRNKLACLYGSLEDYNFNYDLLARPFIIFQHIISFFYLACIALPVCKSSQLLSETF